MTLDIWLWEFRISPLSLKLQNYANSVDILRGDFSGGLVSGMFSVL